MQGIASDVRWGPWLLLQSARWTKDPQILGQARSLFMEDHNQRSVLGSAGFYEGVYADQYIRQVRDGRHESPGPKGP